MPSLLALRMLITLASSGRRPSLRRAAQRLRACRSTGSPWVSAPACICFTVALAQAACHPIPAPAATAMDSKVFATAPITVDGKMASVASIRASAVALLQIRLTGPPGVSGFPASKFQEISIIFETCLAMARQDVRPGLSMPKRLTRPFTPCVSGPSMTKSAAGSPSIISFGRMPQ